MITVVIPWRARNRDRTAAKGLVARALREMLPSARIILADSGHEPFNRAASRNHGVHQAASGVVIVCDADTIPQPGPLCDAVAEAGTDGLLHLPYTRYRPLTRTGTASAIHGIPLSECDAQPETYGSQGGVLVINADAWRDAGGMDERFTGWGFEDTAFHAAAETLLGETVRHEGTIHHLWHPSDVRIGSATYEANRRHCRRYEAAYGDAEAMRRLQQEVLAERPTMAAS